MADQEEHIDTFEQAIETTVENTNAAVDELAKAASYQKKARKCKVAMCIAIVVLVMLLVAQLLLLKPR